MSDVSKWEKQLQRLLVDGSETSKIVAAVEKILSASPKHVFALRCKVVYLLHQDKHAAALTALQQWALADPSIRDKSQEYAFQKAYCLYRSMEYRQAHAVLKRAPHTSEDVASQHLLAQLHYNLEEFEEAARIYETLLAKNAFRDDHEKTELQTNYAAACAAIDAQKTQAIVHAADEKTADLLYNAATAQLEMHDYTAAMQTLQQAETLCARAHPKSRLRSFQDVCAKSDVELQALLDVKNSPERSFFNDVAAIWVQMAYVNYETRHEDKASALLNVVLRYRPSSTVTLAVASINWAAIQKHIDFFDTHRKLKMAQNPAVSSRLTSRQRLLVRYNTAMLLLHTSNLNGFRRQVEHIADEYPNSDLTHSLKLALAVLESKKKRQSNDKTVAEYLKNYQQSVKEQQKQEQNQRNPVVGKMITLIAAQIFFENGDLEHAIESLSSAPEEIRQKPCTLVTLFTWKVQIGDVKGAKQLLIDFIGSTSKKPTVVREILTWVVQSLASRGLYADAVDVIRAVHTAVPVLEQDKEILALMALCLSHYDMPSARACMEKIPEAIFTGTSSSGSGSSSAKKLSSSSLAELESQQPSRQQIEALGYHRISGGEDQADGGKVKRTRRRPMRHPPKNLEARVDPERWLPMSRRSYIKDLPERRKRELKRLRASEQEQKRHEAEKRKAAATTVATAAH
ncbi:putative signal recognition particle protein [Trypanosoma theileri]|uniref:Signal recognition particle subunit SRP72 n=1 Tax=Trypanosoma theileri TaxID=67003 RepID=A0A1X0P6G4_9TRYP|nr:putative signal recognition particle protein [Trypanosoma theileri]ORC92448.1 putative signal recognition particle protein [Trypanosoma theileri]